DSGTCALPPKPVARTFGFAVVSKARPAANGKVRAVAQPGGHFCGKQMRILNAPSFSLFTLLPLTSK
nr:hypothetical protein [Tanacetum cinerariifolium]